jgi:hypothetical protein
MTWRVLRAMRRERPNDPQAADADRVGDQGFLHRGPGRLCQRSGASVRTRRRG